jgi:hypothetical protein
MKKAKKKVAATEESEKEDGITNMEEVNLPCLA